MKLSHIHENTRDPIDRSRTPFPSVGKTLTDYLNSNRIYPSATLPHFVSMNTTLMQAIETGEKIFDIELKIHGFADRPISLTENGPFKTVRYELIEYESIPESDNPLDNIRDEFTKDFAMFAAVVEGTNKFEGQFAWYNEDLISYEQIWPLAEMRRGLCWEEGRPPKLPRQYKR